MGRHAREATRLRVSVSTIVLGTLIVTVVAVGSLLSSSVQSTPTKVQGVEGTAVVASSSACRDGAGSTLVDVLSPAGFPVGTDVRANLDACGYREGERLAVQFAADDPTQVTLLGNPVDATVTGDRLLPYGLALVALLAAGAAAAVFLDASRGRRGRAQAARHLAALRGTETDAPPAGRHARLETDHGETSWPDPAKPAAPQHAAGAQRASDPAPDMTARTLLNDRALSSVDLSFPSPASLADSLHDELFTHRTVTS